LKGRQECLPHQGTVSAMAEKKPTGPLKQLKVFAHDREIVGARFTPCGKYVIAGGYDALLHRWDLGSGERTELKGHDGWLQGLVFHPDGKRMFTADSWGRVSAWTYADGKLAWTKDGLHKGWMKNLAISGDGAWLATCGADQVVRVWASADGALKLELKGHEESVFSVAFHPDGKSLVSGDLRGVVKLWDLATGKVVREIDAKVLYLNADEINEVGGVRFLVFDPTGQTLACGGGQPLTSGFVTSKPAVVLVDWESGKQKQLMQLADAVPDDGFAVDLLWHPGGFVAVVCSGAPGRGALWCWRPGEKAPFYVNKELIHCRSVSLHKDGVRLAVGQVGRSPGGNGRELNKQGEYEGNTSSVKIFETAFAGA
jgi:hypothetical protein